MEEIGQVSREKNWDELTDTEKIERMHQVVKNLMHSNQVLHSLLRTVRDHYHSDGKVLVSIYTDQIIEPEGSGRRIGCGDWF